MRYLAIVLTFVLWSGVSAAQEDSGSAPAAEYNTFGVPNQVLREITAPNRPENLTPPDVDCNDAGLLQQVRDKISELQKAADDENVVERRARLLALKHIGSFAEQNPAEFQPKDNYRVANRIIAVKINRHLKDGELKLCVSGNPVLDRKIYMLIYRFEGSVYVEIINYTATVGDGEPFIIYEKPLAKHEEK